MSAAFFLRAAKSKISQIPILATKPHRLVPLMPSFTERRHHDIEKIRLLTLVKKLEINLISFSTTLKIII